MKTLFSRMVFLTAAIFVATTAAALCPHEVLVLANDESLDSVLVAKTFMRLYGVPERNLVRLAVPEAAVQSGVISPETFTELIWEPARRAVEERGLQGQILAWAYSCDFPFRVKTDPQLSITGLTFLRNRLPEDMQVVAQAAYRSPLYAGPWQNDANAVPPSRTFDRLHASLLDDMPLPAMMLGWTGVRGNTVDEVLDMLERGRASDGTRPSAAYMFATNTNIRSIAREWQFPGAVRALAALGAKARVTDAFPKDGRTAGLMTGRESLPDSQLEFAPGAFADHLTSSAAEFHASNQTKLSEWIRRGATASAGTVIEPKAYWQKFPAAALFLHQRRGCTMIESIYLATVCPLQLLPVGDPLASPWAERPHPRIEGNPADSKPLAEPSRCAPCGTTSRRCASTGLSMAAALARGAISASTPPRWKTASTASASSPGHAATCASPARRKSRSKWRIDGLSGGRAPYREAPSRSKSRPSYWGGT